MAAVKTPPGHFVVLYFAGASSYVSKASGGHDFLAAPMLASTLFDALDRMYAGFQEKVLHSCLLNINDEYVDLEEEASKGEGGLRITEGSVVVIVPPVSAG